MSLRDAAQQALEALELAGMSHDVMLMSDPPQDAWKARSVSWKLAQAMTALRAALAEDAMQRLTDVQQEIEAAMADQVTHGLGITLDGKRIDPASIYKQAESATCQESRQVEPVAYIKGYSKGRCIIEAVDPDWLLPVGMALYRSPPTIKDNLTVEPVAVWELQKSGWEIICDGDWVKELPLGTKLYTAPPKREPLTEEKISAIDWKSGETLHDFARAIERAHGIGGEE